MTEPVLAAATNLKVVGWADFITIHTLLNDITRNIISADALNKTKKSVRIINCARGGLVDELALAAAIDNGHVAGAALDVFVNEPATDNILFEFGNVVATPDLGASTLEAQEKVALQVAEQMADYLTKVAITNALNTVSVWSDDAPILRPYIGLGARLGSFLGQVESIRLKLVVIELDGRVAKLNADPIVASTLAGLLGPAMEPVNMVNAAAVASGNGIAVSIIRHDRQCDYETLLRVTIKHDGGEHTIAGTLKGGNILRIIGLQSIAIETDFPENLLYLRNYDKPGFIGDLATLFGRHGLNIATFHLGRRAVGGEAVALVDKDSALPAGALDEIKSLPEVLRVDSLQFPAQD